MGPQGQSYSSERVKVLDSIQTGSIHLQAQPAFPGEKIWPEDIIMA